MLRNFCCLCYFVCFTSICISQTNDNPYGVVITKIQQRSTGRDTSRYFYIRNKIDDRLTVYIIADGVVS